MTINVSRMTTTMSAFLLGPGERSEVVGRYGLGEESQRLVCAVVYGDTTVVTDVERFVGRRGRSWSDRTQGLCS